jgi:hypothetical protein
VLVCEGRHGQITIEYRGRALRWQEIAAPAKPSVWQQYAPKEAVRERRTAPRKPVPPSHHPWRELFSRAEQKRQRGLATPKWGKGGDISKLLWQKNKKQKFL